MCAAKQVITLVVLLQCLLPCYSQPQPPTPSHQILVVHINQTLSNSKDAIYENIQSTNPHIKALCTIYRNESNNRSFTSLYMTGYNQHTDLSTMASFHHMIHINDIPSSCIHKQTKNDKKYTQTPIDFITDMNENDNKVLVDDIDEPHTSPCPTKTWEYFIWSIQEWWFIYACVMCIGVFLGAVTVFWIMYCCWKSKKKKFIKQIISDYKKNKLRKKANGMHKDHYQINIIHQRNGKKHKYDADHHPHQRKRQRSSKYAKVAMNDSNEENSKKKKKKRNHNHLHPHHLSISPMSDEYTADTSGDDDVLLNNSCRMKSNSDPSINPHHREIRHSRSNGRKKRSKSTRKSRARSRSPWEEKRGSDKMIKEDGTYDEYRFRRSSTELLQAMPVYEPQPRHSSKSKKRNKNKKQNRSKSPAVDRKPSKRDHGAVTPKAKKSIGIDLARMKAKNYEENRRESMPSNDVGSDVQMHNMVVNVENDMVIHEGVSANVKSRKSGHLRNGSASYMGSITNVNDEGIAAGAIENILTEMKQMNRLNVNENENEESSSFTIKSVDVLSANEAVHKKADEDDLKVGGDGHVLVSTNTKGFQLPKAKTKGGWL